MSDTNLLEIFLESEGVSIDTRTISKGQIFWALKGDNFNGNSFVETAIEKGAIWAVGEEPPKVYKDRFIHVKSALRALQELATEYRRHLGIQVLGLTGSNGKTINKELLAQILKAKFKVHFTQGNLNNHIGVPLTLLSTPRDTEFMVVEMGANHQKEIKQLAQIAQPNYGMITNIGKAHLEGFGGYEGVRRGKKELYDYIQESGEVFFLNDIEPSLEYLPKTQKVQSTSYLYDEKGVEINWIGYHPVSLRISDFILETSLFGEHNARNLNLCIAVGLFFEIPLEVICRSLYQFKSLQNRGQQVTKNKWEIVLDAYNANPTSMRASIQSFLVKSGSPCGIILGEMLELGEYSDKEHQDLLDFIWVQDKKPDWVWTFGDSYQNVQTNEKNKVRHFSTFDQLKEAFLKLVPLDHGYVLIKGSRGNRLERLMI